jgi:hypothetical protein
MISAYAPAPGKLLWSRPISFDRWRGRRADADEHEESVSDVPTVIDLEGDGRPEVIAPEGTVQGSPYDPMAGVQVLEGATGRVRWRHPAKVNYSPGPWLRVAPDLDGDGVRDVVEASRFLPYHGPDAYHHFLFVDALSGRDGRPLWWWARPLEGANETLGCLRWWQDGPDGRPELVVGIKGTIGGKAFILEGGSGRLRHTIVSVPDPGVADLDGDGRLDLWGAQGNRLQAIRGGDPECWRWLAQWVKAEDYDGDDVADLVRFGPDPSLPTNAAISGRDGRLLWVADVDSGVAGINAPNYTIKALSRDGPGSDLDGDGTPDLLATKSQFSTDGQERQLNLPIAAISGKTGRKLWTPGAIAIAHAGSANASIAGVDATDLDGDGVPEVLVGHDLHHTNPGGGRVRWRQAWLTLLSGRDGSFRWTRRLDPEHDETKEYPAAPFPHATADLDGDGIRDVLLAQLVPADATEVSWAFDLRALDGRSGRPLWHHRFATIMRREGVSFQFVEPRFAVGDLDGDGKAEILVREPADAKAAGRRLEFAILDGTTGAKRWDWHRDGTPDTVPIHLARLGRDDRRSIVLRVPDGLGTQEILVLDQRGGLAQRRPRLVGWGLAVHDLGGDGADEFVFFDGATLHVTRGGCLDDVWKRTRVGTTPLQTFGEIRPARNHAPATIIVNGRIGLEGTSGRVLWESTPGGTLLDADNRHPGSLAIEWSGNATIARLVAPSPSGLAGRPMVPSVDRVPDADPRRIVLLPWAETYGSVLPPWTIYVICGLICLGLLVFPGWLVARALRRPWRLASLLSLPLAGAIAYGGFRLLVPVLPLLNGTPGLPMPSAGRLVPALALMGLPVVAFFHRLGAFAWDRRWWRLAGYLGFSVAVSVVLAVVLLRIDPRLGPLDRYTWERWPTVWYPGAYLTGLLSLLLANPMGAAWNDMRRLIRPDREMEPSSALDP